MAGFKPSKYQQAFFGWVQTGTGHALIEALAGSGKTTTIVQALDLIPSHAATAFLAFNKSIAQELQTRSPAHVECATVNSIGHRALFRHIGRFQMESKKTRILCREYLSYDAQQEYASDVSKLVGLAKAYAFDPRLPCDWGFLMDRFGIEKPQGQRNDIAQHAQKVLLASFDRRAFCDFDDQLWLTHLLGARLPQFDWLFVDEAQDISPVQRKLIARMISPRGRLVAVGDKHQAIYGFRGGDSESMAEIQRLFGCTVMPLSICYRCPAAVIAQAKKLVPAIEAAPAAKQGEVTSWQQYTGDMFDSGTDLVICRNTKPLIELAYGLIRQGHGVQVLGREIGAGLKNLVTRMVGKRVKQLRSGKGALARLRAKVDAECANLRAEDKADLADALEDKHCTVEVISESTGAETVTDLFSAIDALFAGNGGITLCTIHKSKGLEAERVFILDRHLLPARYAKQDWQQQQERNLEYVAITRAKKALVMIDSDGLTESLEDAA